ncbi:MAG: AbrB/MazE/SpoVT family DNA-binding domain-containing protein [bacterium]|nr:AbrB/MazE/SpoVT family DNA-binding domain-containing protein [bacterium]
MEVTISSKYQVVIPLQVRKLLNIKPGEKAEMMAYGQRIELVPVRPLKQMRGFLKGLSSAIDREGDRV